MTSVIKSSSECEDKPQRECEIAINVNAPITYREGATCQVLWEKSTYSSFGQTWNSFSSRDQGLFVLDQVNHETIWLKVRISCNRHCKHHYHYSIKSSLAIKSYHTTYTVLHQSRE